MAFLTSPRRRRYSSNVSLSFMIGMLGSVDVTYVVPRLKSLTYPQYGQLKPMILLSKSRWQFWHSCMFWSFLSRRPPRTACRSYLSPFPMNGSVNL